ncbi:MAG: M81 family metallopeptidase [Thermomicrobiales bacterium]|nr:M81 family metallopeptidase [Thermomicrobiales bacterium]
MTQPLRIAVAGFAHETNTFASRPTDLADFEANGFRRGRELLELSGTNTVVGGAIDAIAADPSLELVPILATSAIPGGIVTARAAERIESEIAEGLRDSRPDAVVLDLHGAMVTELNDDAEGATLRRVRDALPAGVPVVATLDLHTNITQAMVDGSDALLPYNTYPHVDTAERGAEAVRLVARIARGEVRPTSALVKIPLMPQGPNQYSHVEPTSSIMARAFEMEARPGVLNVGVAFAFPFADIPINGMGVVVTTDNDRALAERLARELADYVWERREAFRPEIMSVEEAVHAAMEAEDGPTVLADYGDNPGGGSASDGTALLWGMLDLGAPDAALAVMADPEAVDAAFNAGVGSRLDLMLGGKTDKLHGYPIPVSATVRSLSDGHFVYDGPMFRGAPGSLGRTAVLRCDGRYGNSVDVVVAERRVQALDTAIFRSQGIEPSERKIVAVKSNVHFRGAFTPIAKRIIVVDTPGLTGIDLNRFPFTRLTRPVWPLDEI